MSRSEQRNRRVPRAANGLNCWIAEPRLIGKRIGKRAGRRPTKPSLPTEWLCVLARPPNRVARAFIAPIVICVRIRSTTLPDSAVSGLDVVDWLIVVLRPSKRAMADAIPP